MKVNAATVGRINSSCDALDYELSSGILILRDINRRDTAGSLRMIPSLPVGDRRKTVTSPVRLGRYRRSSWPQVFKLRRFNEAFERVRNADLQTT